jgi:hypothetical protein
MIRVALGQGAALALRSLLTPSVLAGRWVGRRRPLPAGAPSAELTLGLAAKVALDEVFFLTEALSARVISLWDTGRIMREVADALELFGARGWLDAPLSYHRTPPRLHTWTLGRGRSRGLDYEHLAFRSEFEPHPGEPARARWLGYRPNRTGHAWLLRHRGPPRPWLVCVHGYRMGFPLADFLAFPAAWLHHELGLNVAFPVLPLHGPRKVGWRTGDGFLSGDVLDIVHLQTQALWDIRRVIAWLRAEGAPAVGVYGLSLGAYTAALLAALEADLAFVVAGIPPVCYLDLARWNLPASMLGFAERLGLFAWDSLARVLRVISPLALPPQVARDRRYLFAAIADRLVPPGHAIDLWQHWERPRLTWYAGSHVSFGWQPEVRTVLLEALRAARMV